MALILASKSPRRQELLKNAGIEFTVQSTDVSEERLQSESPQDYVRRMAREKALSVARSAAPGALVLGADTAVVAAGQVFGKPADASSAAQMLRLLSGGTHRVLTGICLVRAPEKIEALQCEVTTVIFNPLTEEEIQRYIASREPFDKAGAYGIQGRASKFVKRVEGCFFNVVGLPVAAVCEILKTIPGGDEAIR